ncbi:hypothetical protein [Pedobacter paludis]|uniref:Carboxypeptidase regulatory-like domain-containing protein n=1 Tax=Pedobacter paludis TaxID=2203212 RepID=A0A317F2V0_9SPHI|nr:hypothetical protein [Pedobacter paludis]PWS33451.1 hypothetical protein DF947_02160 [Pedobacter paludis]
MKKLQILILSLIITSTILKANAQKAAYYPQVPFDSLQAKSMLALGTSSIEGVAFTKPKSSFGYKAPLAPKILATNVTVTLFPVTTYFEEWYRLRKKEENKKTSVYMSQEAFRWRITVQTDEYGRFKFNKMKPGKYFIQSFASYSRSGTTPVYRGTGYNNYGGQTDYYEYQSYTNNYTDRIEEFVEITRDGQALEIKLR